MSDQTPNKYAPKVFFTCPGCSTVFKPTSSSQKFHSKKCAREYRRRLRKLEESAPKAQGGYHHKQEAVEHRALFPPAETEPKTCLHCATVLQDTDDNTCWRHKTLFSKYEKSYMLG